MNIPKLKYPRLCRILTYVVVLGGGLLPIFLVFSLPAPDIAKIIVLFASLFALIFYLVRNFMILTMMDMTLAALSCHQTARTQYTLPANRSVDSICRSILRYGTPCEPSTIQPQPFALRYKFSNPMTVYSRGIERVIAVYEVDSLDRDTYRSIFASAKANSKALAGRKKALFLEEQQKRQALHRVTVILILAHKVDPQIAPGLYELVCRQCGDENEDCVVPCVVDLPSRTCVFNCLRIPYVGYSYAVKNRGIRIVKNKVFGGRLTLKGNTHFLEPIRDVDPEASLWDFWKGLHHQFIGAARDTKRRFEALSERELLITEDALYLKWDQRGICQTIKVDAENKLVRIESVENWFYPKLRPIGQKTIRNIEAHITAYYSRQGYEVEFVDIEAVL